MRLHPLTPDELTPEQQELSAAILGKRPANAPFLVAEDGSLLGPFNALLRHPPIGGAVQALGATVRLGGTLPPVPQELVILTVAAHWRCDFQWGSHGRLARRAGLTDEQLEALRTGAPVEGLDDPFARASLDVARALVDRGDLDDDEYASAIDALGEVALVEITALVGYYALLAMQMRVFRVPAFPGVAPAFS
jgi:4-carboxymuconolactone decarboxylase